MVITGKFSETGIKLAMSNIYNMDVKEKRARGKHRRAPQRIERVDTERPQITRSQIRMLRSSGHEPRKDSRIRLALGEPPAERSDASTYRRICNHLGDVKKTFCMGVGR